MVNWIKESRSARGLFAVMLLLALSIRAAVPAGYMPAQTSMGLVVTLCSGEVGKQIVIDIPMSDERSDHGDHGGDHRDTQKSTCAYASLTAPGLEGSDAAPVNAPALLLAEIALPPPIQAAPASASFILPPSQGPPSAA